MDKLKEFFKKKSVIITLSVILAVLLIAAGFAWYIYPCDYVARGVMVDDIEIGRLTKEEAETAIATDSIPEGVIITVTDETGALVEIKGEEIGLCYDALKTVESAYQIGRSGEFFKDAIDLVTLAFSPRSIDYKYGVDEEKLTKAVYDFGVSINGEMKEYTLEYKDSIVNVSLGNPGQVKDVSEQVTAVKEAIDKGEFEVSVKMEKGTPSQIDAKSLCEYIYVEPKNASYTIDGSKINMVDEVYGKSVDENEVASMIDMLKNGETITLNVAEVKPEVTAEDLWAQLFNYTLGSFSSKYNASNKNRSHNVMLAAQKINGLILAPGEVFSYNNVLGPRTVERGFKEAPVYANGESVMGIGGGICQVSSTLYSAVLYSDLDVVERRNHSMTVDYVPNGQDATVSYGTIDFKFKNSTDKPIRISAVASDGNVTVSIAGTKPEKEKKVEVINNTLKVISKTVEQVSDPSLSAGKTKTISVGKTGYVIETYKKVYENGVEVKNQYMGKSTYKMVPQKKAVGGAVQSTPSTTPETSVESAPAYSENVVQEAPAQPEKTPEIYYEVPSYEKTPVAPESVPSMPSNQESIMPNKATPTPEVSNTPTPETGSEPVTGNEGEQQVKPQDVQTPSTPQTSAENNAPIVRPEQNPTVEE